MIGPQNLKGTTVLYTNHHLSMHSSLEAQLAMPTIMNETVPPCETNKLHICTKALPHLFVTQNILAVLLEKPTRYSLYDQQCLK
jgi:hypothetical protein